MLFITLILSMLISPFAISTPLDYNNLYLAPKKNKPEVIIFYNPLIPCKSCPQTIDKIITVLKQNYKTKINAYLINLNQYPSFIYHFRLQGPLTLVVIRIKDYTSFGYNKLTGLQSEISDPISFKNIITEFINNFIF